MKNTIFFDAGWTFNADEVFILPTIAVSVEKGNVRKVMVNFYWLGFVCGMLFVKESNDESNS